MRDQKGKGHCTDVAKNKVEARGASGLRKKKDETDKEAPSRDREKAGSATGDGPACSKGGLASQKGFHLLAVRLESDLLRQGCQDAGLHRQGKRSVNPRKKTFRSR